MDAALQTTISSYTDLNAAAVKAKDAFINQERTQSSI
jgi:hypothetical protein